jgi:hypothetical protein
MLLLSPSPRVLNGRVLTGIVDETRRLQSTYEIVELTAQVRLQQDLEEAEFGMQAFPRSTSRALEEELYWSIGTAEMLLNILGEDRPVQPVLKGKRARLQYTTTSTRYMVCSSPIGFPPFEVVEYMYVSVYDRELW